MPGTPSRRAASDADREQQSRTSGRPLRSTHPISLTDRDSTPRIFPAELWKSPQPKGVAGIPRWADSASVCAWGRAVTRTVRPSPRNLSTNGFRKCTCGVFSRSTHTQRERATVTQKLWKQSERTSRAARARSRKANQGCTTLTAATSNRSLVPARRRRKTRRFPANVA